MKGRVKAHILTSTSNFRSAEKKRLPALASCPLGDSPVARASTTASAPYEMTEYLRKRHEAIARRDNGDADEPRFARP